MGGGITERAPWVAQAGEPRRPKGLDGGRGRMVEIDALPLLLCAGTKQSRASGSSSHHGSERLRQRTAADRCARLISPPTNAILPRTNAGIYKWRQKEKMDGMKRRGTEGRVYRFLVSRGPRRLPRCQAAQCARW